MKTDSKKKMFKVGDLVRCQEFPKSKWLLLSGLYTKTPNLKPDIYLCIEINHGNLGDNGFKSTHCALMLNGHIWHGYAQPQSWSSDWEIFSVGLTI